MTSTFMPFHIAANAERLPTTLLWTLEGFLTRMRVRMDPQARRAGEGLVTRLTDVSVL
jgi:hypothetical protein